MARRAAGIQLVQIGAQFFHRQAMVLRQPLQGLLRIIAVAVDFRAVAGGNNGRLTCRLRADQAFQCVGQHLGREGKLLAHR
jgi:hypothetical protein